ncbi:MAG: hypothetical protein ABI426_03365, partial [Flavobacterium sp.]
LQTSIRGIHQCLVAEVFFNGDPTPHNATPSSSDNLSQRNLAIAHSDNPGSLATHTVQHTFEIKPSQFHLPKEFSSKDFNQSFLNTNTFVATDQPSGPDILMIHWNNLPRDSKVILYMPDIKVDDILALEPYTRVSPTKISMEDGHSFSFTTADISYIPIPGGFNKNIPGLLTVELPSNVVKGQLFKVLVQQARFYRNTRRIIGSFQFNISVSTAEIILKKEMRNLSLLQYVRESMAVTDPWRMIFNRYIKSTSDKINGLGGDASTVPSSYNDKWLYVNNSETSTKDFLVSLMNKCCKRMSIFMILLLMLLLVIVFLIIVK